MLAEALAILQDEAFIVDDARLIGKYGAHSRPSLAAARLFDDTCSMSSPSGEEVPGLVLCGHFTAKAMAAMCHDLRCREHAGKTMILWQVIRPRLSTPALPPSLPASLHPSRLSTPALSTLSPPPGACPPRPALIERELLSRPSRWCSRGVR